jgi:hypothetical protein
MATLKAEFRIQIPVLLVLAVRLDQAAQQVGPVLQLLLELKAAAAAAAACRTQTSLPAPVQVQCTAVAVARLVVLGIRQ